MEVYKIDDVIQFEFFRIPKILFANKTYRTLSSDAKLTYALLFDRLSLSMRNGWVNESDAVYLIYTREDISIELGISYKKAISAFRELISAGLICEKRCGRGMVNRIYIIKPELAEKESMDVTSEQARTAETKCLDKNLCNNDCDEMVGKKPVLKNENGISGMAETEDSDMLKTHIKTTKMAYLKLPYLMFKTCRKHI